MTNTQSASSSTSAYATINGLKLYYEIPGAGEPLLLSFQGWPDAEIEAIKAPTLLIVGDADIIPPEHAIKMFHLLGGALPDGGMGPMPASQLAILPATNHFGIADRIDLLLPIITPFLNPPAAAHA